MATVLITVPGVAGTILNMLPIAEALAKRGHRVLLHTGQRDYAKVQATGVELIPMSEHCNLVSRLKKSSVRLPWWVPGFARPIWCFRNEILAIIPDMVAELEPIIKREQVDCLVADSVCFSAAYAAERLGIPFVTFTSSWTTTLNANALPVAYPVPLPPRIVHTAIDFIFPLRRVRKQLGLPQRPLNAPAELFCMVTSKLLNLVTIYREFIPCEQLQENQVFIGPTAFGIPRTTDDQPCRASLEPGTVLVSTTTSANMDNGLFRRLLEAVAQMGIPVLATSGSATNIPSGLGENVRLETFVPYDEVLPHVRALVTHGGPGTVGRALRYGIPMLIIPNFGDQLPTGVRAAELGLAYHLPKSKATSKAIQSKLKALLQDHALHDRVKTLSVKLRSMDSKELAANAIEGILQNSQMTRKAIKATDKIASS
ncbi:MAG: glycosyltransferase family 1 protein [Stigonema ocellatum SAG 48.90 = DSM 106950]|nr:glycosyltransferase family 1 protein [Stigonema ocellatum SAG 48.90 = DSM 106950]